MTVQNADGLVETAENSLVGSEYHMFFLKKKQKNLTSNLHQKSIIVVVLM